jgi:hypothetical protein
MTLFKDYWYRGYDPEDATVVQRKAQPSADFVARRGIVHETNHNLSTIVITLQVMCFKLDLVK